MKYSNDNVVYFSTLKYIKLFCLKSVLLVLLASCGNNKELPIKDTSPSHVIQMNDLEEEEYIREMEYASHTLRQPVLGIERLHLVLDSLKGKQIAVVGNQTSVVRSTHLVDTLLSLHLNVKKSFHRSMVFAVMPTLEKKFTVQLIKKQVYRLFRFMG